ncbi:hypothetical protein M407DRAFT_25427 [Tulasnella calospora MUT 4182]|uniref:Uncharacterized protein n=1 Tax=Tulasnella calospora MUT 4182 TaxID=1051891 RepID=A0A0C3KUM0_9AGAM|nr:hypothetical protein M407DRAFT_25427 [Tulasnella calospora MUT 4182]
MTTATQPALDQESLAHPKRTLHVLDLPYDILYLIITFTWIDPGQEFPVVLSHVCRLWRQYALDTPGFWASLTFKNSIPEIEKYQTWLERSKDSPFDLKIGSKPFTGASIKHAKAILRLIFPHVQRLRSLQVNNIPLKIMQVIFDRLNDVHLPSLETLHVEWVWSIIIDRRTVNRKFKPFRHGDAANLKHVTLRWASYDYVVHRFRNLETLDIVIQCSRNSSRGKAKTVQNILSLLPDLRILRILIEQGSWPEPRSGITVLPPLTHSSLEALHLGASQDEVDTIVCALILPSLRRLCGRFENDAYISTFCLPTLGLARPYPNLLHLQLYAPRAYGEPGSVVGLRDMEFFERALGGLPQLQSLTLSGINLENNKHLICLTRTCPQLKKLVFRSCSGPAVKEVRAMIQNRRDPKGMGSNSLEYLQIDDSAVNVQDLRVGLSAGSA